MAREEEMIKEHECAMNERIPENIRGLMVSALKWANLHPDWHKVSDELPPKNPKYPTESIEVFVTSGTTIDTAQYDFQRAMWIGTIIQNITHWMLPNLPKED